jgi:hypothetical protein
MRSDIDIRICAAQHPLKSMYPTWQGNLSLRNIGREVNRHLAEGIPFQNGADQLHLHRLPKDPFPLLGKPACSAVAEGEGDRLTVAVFSSAYGGEACSFAPPIS